MSDQQHFDPAFLNGLSDYFKNNGTNGFNYPLENYNIYNLGCYLFNLILSSREYSNLPLNHLVTSLSSFGFIEIHSEQEYTNSEYEDTRFCYINWNKQIIITIRIGDEIEDLDVYSDEITLHKEETNLVKTHVFYNKTNSQFLKEFFADLERISKLDYKTKTKNTINFLCHDHTYRLKKVKVDKKDINLELNYGADFLKVHELLIKFLESEKTGLGILYGVSGVGKTCYCRHLLSVLGKKVIYIPPNLISRVVEPDFLTFLLNQNDFILIIEDAEGIVTNRKDTGDVSAVSNLLNLSDGILGECIKARIVCTFNTEITNIDPALIRKGRLKCQYEFKPLEPAQANKLFKHLNIDHTTKEPMILGDIYNFNVENFRKEKEKVKLGFGK
mgnify:FL=1